VALADARVCVVNADITATTTTATDTTLSLVVAVHRCVLAVRCPWLAGNIDAAVRRAEGAVAASSGTLQLLKLSQVKRYLLINVVHICGISIAACVQHAVHANSASTARCVFACICDFRHCS
jgi:hypothetical protein